MHTMLLVGTHIGILLLFFLRKKIPPCTLDCLIVVVSVAKHCFLTRQIHLPFLSFFWSFLSFFSLFYILLHFPRGMGLLTKSELSMTRHIFLCICYIICCLKISICCPSNPAPKKGPLLLKRSPPRPTLVGPSGMDGEAAYYSL